MAVCAFRTLLLSILLLAGACAGHDGGASAFDAGVPGPDAADYPPARTDVVAAVGSDTTLDVATWNLENFPKRLGTPEDVADLVASLDLDLVVLQEIANTARFDEVLGRLPGYQGLLSNHVYGDGSYQKLGFIYKSSVVEIDSPALLFQNSGYEFPRPPLKVRVAVIGRDLDFDAIAVHLKAGLSGEDQNRRREALELLESNVRSGIEGSGDDEVMVIGDFNETLDKGAEVMGPWLTESDLYHFESEPLADDGGYSFIPSRALIDHIVTSSALDAATGGEDVLIPDLVDEFDGYTTEVSDHLPVVLRIPL